MEDLKGLRQRKDLSQRALAARVGVSHQTIVAWENGTVQPRPHHIVKLAEVLGVDAEQLPSVLRAAAAEKRRQALAR